MSQPVSPIPFAPSTEIQLACILLSATLIIKMGLESGLAPQVLCTLGCKDPLIRESQGTPACRMGVGPPSQTGCRLDNLHSWLRPWLLQGVRRPPTPRLT